MIAIENKLQPPPHPPRFSQVQNNNSGYSAPMMAMMEPNQQPTARWHSLVDNCVIELLASLFLNLTTLFCWNSESDTSIMLIPGISMGLIMLCLKDEDYFFPDGSPMVTLVLWVLGGYSWLHMAARLIGQCAGFALAVWICSNSVLPDLACKSMRHATPLLVFVLEMIGTTLEHMAVVYVVMPLLPPAHIPSQISEGFAFVFPKVKPKSHQDSLVLFIYLFNLLIFFLFVYNTYVRKNRHLLIRQLCMLQSPCQHCTGVCGGASV